MSEVVTQLVSSSSEKKPEDLVARLIADGFLKEENLDDARTVHAEQGGDLVGLLIRLGLVSERNVSETLSSLLGLPLWDNKTLPDEGIDLGAVSYRFLRQHMLLPVAADDNSWTVVAANPQDAFISRALGMAAKKTISYLVGIPSDIESSLEKLYGGGRSMMGEIAEGLGSLEGDDGESVEHLRELASEAPVIRLVNIIMQRAVESRASDIHIEPFENHLKVRYRVDGVLQEVESPPASSAAAVISRIKIMAHLNIAERRLPQDGRIMHRVQGKELDLRVSTIPTAHGESVVMRILDRESIVLNFSELGFNQSLQQRFIKQLEMPHGIILVTGPTGSGKTTTLYTALSQLNSPERKIITVEDPVEYQLEGINQIQAKASIGLDFASALRAIVRQDPDVIMIGEMRDLETARIAIQSALTGHLVLSTIHTNDAAGAVTRMLDMGVEDYLLTSTINSIMAQRLVRTLNRDTAEAYAVLPEMAAELGMDKISADGSYTFYRAIGSSDTPTGYQGRTTILELLEMSDSIRRLVINRATAGEIQDQAVAEGMITMYQDGLEKCLQGVTTLEEILRVTQEA